MKANIAIALALVAVGIAIWGNLGNGNLGAATSGNTTNFDAITLDNGNLTLTNGSISVANPTSGTSTLATIGCINAYATSSATKIKLIFNTTATTTSINGSTPSGFVLWAYGNCP